jgi:hypothetical protein
MKRLVLLCLLLGPTACKKAKPVPETFTGFVPSGPHVTVLFTGDGHGEVAPCG